MSDRDSNNSHGPSAGRHSLSDLSGGTDWASVCADVVDAHGVAIVATTASHLDSRRVDRLSRSRCRHRPVGVVRLAVLEGEDRRVADRSVPYLYRPGNGGGGVPRGRAVHHGA